MGRTKWRFLLTSGFYLKYTNTKVILKNSFRSLCQIQDVHQAILVVAAEAAAAIEAHLPTQLVVAEMVALEAHPLVHAVVVHVEQDRLRNLILQCL